MLTSFEEFDYIKQAMGAGVVDYLVKLDLTPENLQTALAKAAEKVKKERALLGELSAQENLAESVRSYQERFFVRLYAGLFPDEAALEQPLQHMELNLASNAYLIFTSAMTISGFSRSMSSSASLPLRAVPQTV